MGAIGGVEKLLMNIFVFLLGGYAKFNQSIEIIHE